MSDPIQSDLSKTFKGGGCAGDLLRGQDWAQIPLGDPTLWPQPLTTLVRVMLNSGQPMFIAWGPQRILLYNDAYAAMLGPRHPQAFAQPFFETWPEVLEEVGALMNQVFDGEPVHMDDLKLTLFRNGYPEETHFSFSYTPVPDDHGEIIGLFCACIETTGRVSAERQKVIDANRERDQLFEISRDLFGVATYDGYLKSINPAWSQQLGRSSEDILARPFSELIHPDDLDLTGEVVATLKGGLPVHQFHVRLVKADGSPISFAWSAAPGANLDDGFFYTVGRDITEDLRREEALRQGHKMEAVGQLTGGLAHDFNNLLQAAHGCLDLILRSPNNPDRVTRLAKNGLQATARGAKLTAQLLAFSRAQKFELRPINLTGLISGMTEILQSSVGPLVHVSVEGAAGELGILCDPTQLEMALLNLAINARDAMPEGGQLLIMVSRPWVHDDPDLPPGEYVQISVSDTGPGMSAAVAARAFEPFFTTKGIGNGTGLGLSQVYAMATQAKGAARIDRDRPVGLSVKLLLPSVAPPLEAKASDKALSVSTSVLGKTVLVVDDDPDVRLFFLNCLEGLGYDVLSAVNAEQGLNILATAQSDVMIVDYAMPGMNGAQMAMVVRANNPLMPIVFATGYSETAAIEEAVGHSAVWLKKPFGVYELELVLKTVLKE